jgi:hypothetical protein
MNLQTGFIGVRCEFRIHFVQFLRALQVLIGAGTRGLKFIHKEREHA